MVFSSNQSLDIDSRLDSGVFPAGIEVNVSMASGETYRRVFSMGQGGA